MERLAEGVDLKMVLVPAGVFVMGTPNKEIERLDEEYQVRYFKLEKPQKIVRVSSFCMGQMQVTQAQWREVASWEQVERKLNSDPSNFKGNNRPVDQVSWLDAKEFCARLRQKTGKEYRLPGEAEWEYACRAENSYQSSVTRDQLSQLSKEEEQKLIKEWNEKYLTPFHFGETITTNLVNYGGDSYGKGKKGEYRQETVEVGRFPANKFGLYDMHGNVYDWCEDDYHESYEGLPIDGSAWTDPENSNAQKVRRGGSWRSYAWACRSALRNADNRDRQKLNNGFRVVCALPKNQ